MMRSTRRVVVHVVERVVLLADDGAAVRGDDLADLGVQHVRPDVVGRRQVEGPRAGVLHQPREQRLDLLRRDRAGAEDQRIALLPFILLGVDVELRPRSTTGPLIACRVEL